MILLQGRRPPRLQPQIKRVRRHVQQLGNRPLVDLLCQVTVDLVGQRIKAQILGWTRWAPAASAAATCEAKAAEKKLAGAAKNSFVKKCEKDSAAPAATAAQVCESKAAEKKLAGAAKNSFVKKCEKDATGG
jgi:hypothetical protein